MSDDRGQSGGGVSRETNHYSVVDEIEELNERFQQNAGYGGVVLAGIAGYHSLFNHDGGIKFAGEAALHAALDEVLMEIALDPDLIEQNKGEVTPATMAEELDEQLGHFTNMGDRFRDRLVDEFESKLRGYQDDLERKEVEA